MIRRRARAALFAALLCISVLAGCGTAKAALPLAGRISNCDEVVASIRHGLKNHAASITITFDYGSDIFDELNGVIDAWVEEALKETDDPAEGDYIRYQYGGYTRNSSYGLENGRWRYTVKLTPEYYTRLAQEQLVTEKTAELMRGFRFRLWTSDYEKIRTIYDYICQNVRYDKVHRKNPYAHTKSTAYAALVQNTATCQGYCAALYRLLREAGIDCRIVTGAAEGEALHAWVIAELGGLYYSLDPTWDAGSGEYRYFLAGENDFQDHVRGERFVTAEFLERYPMAEECYVSG